MKTTKHKLPQIKHKLQHLLSVAVVLIFLWLAYGSDQNGNLNLSYNSDTCAQCSYDKHIALADSTLAQATQMRDYTQARASYQNALEITGFQNHKYPKLQIEKIDSIIVTLNKKNYQIYIQKANGLLQAQAYSQAYSLYKQAYPIAPNAAAKDSIEQHARTIYTQLVQLAKQSKYEQAEAYYLEAQSIDIIELSAENTEIDKNLQILRVEIAKKQQRARVLYYVLKFILALAAVALLTGIIATITTWDPRDNIHKVINTAAGFIGIIGYFMFDAFDNSLCLQLRYFTQTHNGIIIALVSGFVPFLIGFASTLSFVTLFNSRSNANGERIILSIQFFIWSFYTDNYLNTTITDSISQLLPNLSLLLGFILYALVRSQDLPSLRQIQNQSGTPH
ncbi:MAG: hypothetical protein RIS47_10 [Bacteroidota bacterium]